MTSFSLSCILSPERKDLAVAACYALGMLGCEEVEDPSGVRVTFYFGDSVSLGKVEYELFKCRPLSAISIACIDEEDWNRAWRESIEPVLVAPGVWVSPAWLAPPLKPGDHWIKIEPRMAFGSGHHETTRLAANALIGFVRGSNRPLESLLDIGTGSGILCFCAEFSGVARCVGVDTDPLCAANLSENRADNDPLGRTAFAVGGVECLSEEARFDVVVMNMILTESAPLLDRVREMLGKHGALVWSGLLATDKQAAIDAARRAGLALTEDISENEWWCGTFKAGLLEEYAMG